MKLQEIRSKKPKHRGAIFFKVEGSWDNFVCKFYPGHEKEAEEYKRLMEERNGERSSEAE